MFISPIMCAQGVKSLLIAVILVGLVPLLLGLIFQLVIIAPLRVPLDQSPVFFPWQVWITKFCLDV